jgi:hypothetical protein
MLSIMPIDLNSSSLDLNLEYSLRDLKHLKINLKYDLAIWFCSNDLQNENSIVSPLQMAERLESLNEYKLWFTKQPNQIKIHELTYVIKESKCIIICISDQFAIDGTSLKVYELVKNILKKNYILIEFGISHKWLENSALAAICSDKVKLIYLENNLQINFTTKCFFSI